MASTDDDERNSDDEVARLLAQAGRGPAPSDDQLRRWRAFAHRDWRRAVRRRRLRVAALPLGLLATAALLVWTLDRRAPSGSGPEPQHPSPAIADVLRVVGDVGQLLPGAAGAARLHDGDHLRARALVATRDGMATLAWYGGPEIRLDRWTRIRFDREGLVLETGAVYVDTERGRGAPFAVITALGTARHRGTRFEVRLQGGMLRVRVRQGSVALERRKAETVSAGEELSIDASGAAVRRAVEPYGPAWSWAAEAAPVFRLEGRSAKEFLEWAAAEGGWSLHFADDAAAAFAARTTLHGAIEGLSPAAAVAAVLPTCGLDHELRGARLIVRRAAR